MADPYAATSQPTLLREEILYRTVLEQWKRCDKEGAIVTSALRELERELEGGRRRRAQRALERCLQWRCATSLQGALRLWSVACVRIGADAAERRIMQERAARKEIEVQLTLAQEAERAMRSQWDQDREAWQERQEQEMALVASALHARHGQDSRTTAPTPSVLPAQTPASILREVAASPQLQSPRSRFGTGAEKLLKAWERETRCL
jgi:hypothetical protein